MDNMEILMNDYTREFGSGSATVECNIEVTEKGGVSKLLSVSANVKINLLFYPHSKQTYFVPH